MWLKILPNYVSSYLYKFMCRFVPFLMKFCLFQMFFSLTTRTVISPPRKWSTTMRCCHLAIWPTFQKRNLSAYQTINLWLLTALSGSMRQEYTISLNSLHISWNQNHITSNTQLQSKRQYKFKSIALEHLHFCMWHICVLLK